MADFEARINEYNRCPKCGKERNSVLDECSCGFDPRSLPAEERGRMMFGLFASIGGNPNPEPPSEELLDGLTRLARIHAGELPPAPAAITLEWLRDTPDEKLYLLYDYVLNQLGDGDEECDRRLAKLPKGLQFAYDLSQLDGGIENDGVGNYLDCCESRVSQTLNALRAIEAHLLAEFLHTAAYDDEAHFDNWLTEYLRLREIEDLWKLLHTYLRAHPNEFVHHLLTDR